MATAASRPRPSGCIGINASWSPPGGADRLAWYVGHLIEELGALDDRHEWLVVTSTANWDAFQVPRRRWTKIAYAGDDRGPGPAPTVGRRSLAWLRAPRMRRWTGALHDLLRQHGVDLWFCPFPYALPADVSVPLVNAVPDLLHEHAPDLFEERELALRTAGYHDSCARAATTIVPSEFVARDLFDRYGIDRTAVIPLGLDASLHADLQGTVRLAERVRSKHRLERPFVYCPRDGGRRAHHQTVMRAFGLIRQQRRDIDLIVTGRPVDGTGEELRLPPSPAESRAVRHLGPVDRQDRLGLSTAARAVVFGGEVEGFGVSLLEVMSCGTPIVCPPVAALPEVAGDAALYVDPGDPAALAAAVLRLLDDDVLRARLIAAGRQRAQRSTFTETARQTLAVFDEVLAGTWRAPRPPPAVP